MAEGKRQKRPRRSFTDEFKAGAVRLVLDERKTIPQVARDLDLTQSAVRNWVERARADRGKGKPGVLTTAEKEELAALRKEVRTLRMERDILKNGLGRRPTCWTRSSGAVLAQRAREERPAAFW
jgi:transposase